MASAFVVQRIHCRVEHFERPAIEWLSKNGVWRDHFESGRQGIPSRGEYLIRTRQGGSLIMRDVRALLELKDPFLAEVSTDVA